jgi:DNA-binding transcriptional LysR family regulator
MGPSFDKIYERLNQPPLDSPSLLSKVPWDELRAFLAVAKWKSFNAAAAYLECSQPTVARAVDHLQAYFGCLLIERSKSGISLTGKGEELAQTLIKIDEMIFEKTEELRTNKRQAEGTVRIAATEGLGGVFIIDAMEEFGSRYPKISMHLKNPVNIMGFKENQADIVLGYGTAEHKGVLTRPAGFLHLIPMATKEYFAEFGAATLSNISQHRFIDAGYYQSKNETWRAWRDVVAKGAKTHVCDSTINHARMIKAGLGIGLTGSHLLADPDLIPVDLDVHIVLPLFLHVSTERLQSRPVRVVFDWLGGIFNEKHPWFNPELNINGLPREQFTEIYSLYFNNMISPQPDSRQPPLLESPGLSPEGD